MNHRELMLARARKARHKFLELPHDLQDEIIERLDLRELTAESAEELARSRGCKIAGRSISRYYEALRRERGLQQRRERLEQSIAGLLSVDTTETAKAYMKLMIDVGAEAIMAADSDLGKINEACMAISSLIRSCGDLMKGEASEKRAEADLIRLAKLAPKEAVERAAGGLTAEAADEIRQKILFGG